MNNHINIGKQIWTFSVSVLLLSAIGGIIFKYVGNYFMQLAYGFEMNYWYWTILCLIPSILIVCIFNKSERISDLEIKSDTQERKIRELEESIFKERNHSERAYREISKLLESKAPFSSSASIITAMKAHIFDTAADYLDNKWNPAHHTANEIREKLKARVEKAEFECKNIQFKYEFILNALPFLKEFVEPESELLSSAKSKFNIKFNSLQELLKEKEKELEANYSQKENLLRRQQTELLNKEYDLNKTKKELLELLESSTPFSHSATIISNLTEAVFKEAEEHLICSRRAEKAAEIIKEFRARAVAAETKMREMLFKYEYLLSVFPQLQSYVENEKELTSLAKYDEYSTFIENRDRTKDYLSEEEWHSLSDIDKGQLALERWKNKNKSSEIIGFLYEMSVSHFLRSKGHIVEEYGIKKQLEDLGRDIISYKGGVTYIIQCKNWSQKKQIHENIICQLMGTALEYELSHPFETVRPVLATTTSVSEMAQKFAERLNVMIWKIPLKEFPLIKCNINGDSKIYHLPFDQQYWRTQIKDPGEFYAWTVQEAEEKGFRRAMRHIVN